MEEMFTDDGPEVPTHLSYVLDMPVPDSDVARAVRQDLFLSFKFSQGSGLLQHYIFAGLKQYYRQAWPDEKYDQLPAAMRNLMAEMQTMRPPKQHTPTTPNTRETSFDAQRQRYSDVVQDRLPWTVIEPRLNQMSVGA